MKSNGFEWWQQGMYERLMQALQLKNIIIVGHKAIKLASQLSYYIIMCIGGIVNIRIKQAAKLHMWLIDYYMHIDKHISSIE